MENKDKVANAFANYEAWKSAWQAFCFATNGNPNAAPKYSEKFDIKFGVKSITGSECGIEICGYYYTENGYKGIDGNKFLSVALQQVLDNRKELILDDMQRVLKSLVSLAAHEYTNELEQMQNSIKKELETL